MHGNTYKRKEAIIVGDIKEGEEEIEVDAVGIEGGGVVIAVVVEEDVAN